MPNESKQKAAKQEAVRMAIEQIEKQFGQGTIMKLGEQAKQKVAVIPTGSLALDLALGVGGVPRGRIIEIFGPEASGKTSLALHIVAECQKQGGTAAFIDAEHALDPIYAKKIGVDVDNLLLSQPDTGEQALEIAETLVRSGAVDIFVVDSVAALVPRAEIEGEMGDQHVGLHARLMSQAMRKLAGVISKSRTTALFLNQLRMKIGVMFGNPEVTTGGMALKFYSSVRMDMRRIEQIKDGEKILGNRHRVKIVKNKVSPPFRLAEFDIIYGEGISKTGDLLDVGLDLEIISRSGNWYSFDKQKIGQGREGAKDFLVENSKVTQKIKEQVLSVLKTPGSSTAGSSPR